MANSVKWIKLSTDMFDDEKIRLIKAMPKGDTYICIWAELLCLAGRQNNDGIFLMSDKPYTAEMLATILNRTPKTVKEAVRVLTDYGMLINESGVLAITKWNKHQSLEELKEDRRDRREYMREYMKEYMRNKRQKSDDVKQNVKQEKSNKLDKLNTQEREEEIELERDLYRESESNNILSPPPEHEKNVYGKFVNVFLSDEELGQLKAQFTDWADRIDKLSLYLESTGKSYKSHYATIVKWAREDEKSGSGVALLQRQKKNNFANYGGDEGMNDFEKKMLLKRVNGK